MTGANKILARTKPVLAAAVFLVSCASLAAGQNEQDLNELYPSIIGGQSMGPIVPGLIRISSYTNFFLTLEDQIGMTAKQRREIDVLVSTFHQRIIQLADDRRLAEAELDRLLAQEEVPLKKVRRKLEEIESINVQMHYRQIETAIKVIKRLTRKQHMKVILAILDERQSGSS